MLGGMRRDRGQVLEVVEGCSTHTNTNTNTHVSLFKKSFGLKVLRVWSLPVLKKEDGVWMGDWFGWCLKSKFKFKFKCCCCGLYTCSLLLRMEDGGRVLLLL